MEMLATFGLVASGLLLATFVIGLLKVIFSNGAAVADQIDRAGFGADAYWKGSLRRQSASSSISTREGVTARVRDGKVELRQTRTISRELF